MRATAGKRLPHAVVLTAGLIALTACTPTSTPNSSPTPPPRTCPDEGPKYPWVTAVELRNLTGEEVLRCGDYGNLPTLSEILPTRQKVAALWEKVYPSDGVALPATFPDPDGTGTVTYRLDGSDLFFYYDGQWHRARPVSATDDEDLSDLLPIRPQPPGLPAGSTQRPAQDA